MWRIALLLLAACAAWAQPRAVEVFGQVGYGRANDDEGSVGSGAVFGGALTVPWTSRWAEDIAIQHQRTTRSPSPDFSFGTRRTLVSPALQYRRGSERSYGFVGFGAGVAIAEAFFRQRGQESASSNTGMTPHMRGGFVAAPAGRLLLRAEVYAAFRYVAPDVGVKLGVGYRF
jgi:hypothetical protein